MPGEAELPVHGVVPVAQMIGEDEAETARLCEMEARARAFLTRFSWCVAIEDLYFGEGIGGVVAVFFARIKPSRPEVAEHLWIIVGDLPSAYLVTYESPNPKLAFEAYVFEMRKWVALAKEGKSSPDVIPVNVPSTREWADSLEGRLNLLEEKIIPMWPEE
jgi:hypothetical protein